MTEALTRSLEACRPSVPSRRITTGWLGLFDDGLISKNQTTQVNCQVRRISGFLKSILWLTKSKALRKSTKTVRTEPPVSKRVIQL